MSDELRKMAREMLAAEFNEADLPYVFDLTAPNERDACALRAIEKALTRTSETNSVDPQRR